MLQCFKRCTAVCGNIVNGDAFPFEDDSPPEELLSAHRPQGQDALQPHDRLQRRSTTNKQTRSQVSGSSRNVLSRQASQAVTLQRRSNAGFFFASASNAPSYGVLRQVLALSIQCTVYAIALAVAGTTYRDVVMPLSQYVGDVNVARFLNAMALIGTVTTLWTFTVSLKAFGRCCTCVATLEPAVMGVQSTTSKHDAQYSSQDTARTTVQRPSGLATTRQTSLSRRVVNFDEEREWLCFYGTLRKPHNYKLYSVPKPLPKRTTTHGRALVQRLRWWSAHVHRIEDPFLQAALRSAMAGSSAVTAYRIVCQMKALWELCDQHPLPDTSTWRPLYLRFVETEDVTKRRILELLRLHHTPRSWIQIPRGPLIVNDDTLGIYPFETELFRGRILIRLRGYHTASSSGFSPQRQQHPYFHNRKRLMQAVIQGSFKQRLAFNQVMTGQVWTARWTHVPSSWALRIITKVISNALPTVATDFTGQEPYLLLPLITACQVVHICNPAHDSPPTITDITLKEDMSLLGPPFTTRRDVAVRRSHFSNRENLRNYFFEPGLVYTLETYQHLFNAMDYKLHLPLFTLDLTRYLNHQPIELNAFLERKYAHVFDSASVHATAPSYDREYLWRIQLCHEKLLT